MTKLLPGAGSLALLFVLAASARGDDYADFKIPAHHQIDWAASFAANSSSGSSDYRNSFGNGAGHGRGVGGSTSSQFSWLADSDPAMTLFSARYLAVGNRTWSSGSAFFDQGPTSSINAQNNSSFRSAHESWMLAASHRWYPWATPLGFSVGLVSQGVYNQAWLHSNDWTDVNFAGGHNISLSRLRTSDWRYDHVTAGSTALGLGRVRDATAVYELSILEQRLLETGALTRPLSPAARQQLAALFYLRGSYGSFRERPARFLWKDVERVLRDDGALGAEGLDGYSILRAGEPVYGGSGSRRDGLPASPIARLRGFFVGATLTDIHQQTIERRDDSRFNQDVVNDVVQPPSNLHQSERAEAHFDRVLAGPSAEFHRPMGGRWQVDAAGQALFPTRKQDKGLDISNGGSVTALLADRWLARFSLSQFRTVVRRTTPIGDVTDADDWGWSYGASWLYYLEDRLSLQLSVSEFQEKHGSFQSANHQRSAGLNIGLNYRFLGRFQAPGILEPANLAGGK